LNESIRKLKNRNYDSIKDNYEVYDNVRAQLETYSKEKQSTSIDWETLDNELSKNNLLYTTYKIRTALQAQTEKVMKEDKDFKDVIVSTLSFSEYKTDKIDFSDHMLSSVKFYV